MLVWKLHKTPLRCAACKLEADLSAQRSSTKTCASCKKDVPLKGPPEVGVQDIATPTWNQRARDRT